MKITTETLKSILLERADSEGKGSLKFERLWSSGRRIQCEYKFWISKITKDGFYFRDHETEYVLSVLNNELCECKILN